MDKPTIAVDSAVLGLWEYVPEENEQPAAPERMLILRYSDTEYLVHYPLGKGGMYFRAYPIRVGDLSCVQLQLLGGDQGPPARDEKKLFHVATYRLAADALEIRTLNTDVVDDDLKDTAALQAAFLRRQGDRELFANPGRFRRIVENN